jgi:putative spermidine/putrescine transport system substrate-binding protein
MKKLKLSLLVASSLLSANLVAGELTVVSFGGAYGAAQQKHMIDPYVKATGTKILFEDYSGGVAELKAQVESKNVKWDVLDIEYIDVERACSEGMLEVFPQDRLPKGDGGEAAKDDFIPAAIANECAVGNIVWSVIFAHKNSIKTKPKTIADIFDTKKIAGKRAFRKRPQVNLEWALMADGVALKDIYKVLGTAKGVKRAFAKLDTIKKDIVWFDSWSQAPQLLNDGGAVIVQSANGRIYSAIKKDKSDFNIVWDGQVYDLDGWAIPKGSKNKEEAIKFILSATKTKPLAGMQDVAYGPTRTSSESLIAEDVKPQLPSAHLSKGIKASAEFWADNGSELGEKFTAWLIKK